MFSQVGVIPKDRTSLPSLWREDPATEFAMFQNGLYTFYQVSRKVAPETEMMKKETHDLATLTAHVTINASTFEWEKYSSYGKRLRIVVYMLRVLPKFNGNRTKSRCITDPNELLESDRRLFLLLQTESFSDLLWIFEATIPRRPYPLAHILE